MPTPDPYLAARHAMVVTQLESRGIQDPALLAAMHDIPRHLFVPPHLAHRAYEDNALPSQDGQTISQPYIVAYMTEKLALQPTHTVLEIGTGTGYQTAILAQLAAHVFTIERVPSLAHSAQARLRDLNITNVTFAIGDGSSSWSPSLQILTENSPPSPPAPTHFDRILITAAAPAEPQPLLNQLAPTGLLLLPQGTADLQTLITITRQPDDTLLRHPLIECRFVPLIGQNAWPPKDLPATPNHPDN